ncbi:MAG TPA: gamma-glutamyltransferase [Bryobacteraceae bacterium]|nr:gamma-glutamyltransferase [Bryobacteraceae bacterium]
MSAAASIHRADRPNLRAGLAVAAVCALAAPLFARQPVHARHGMVVAREAHATEAGEAVLEAGGNAIDAAVAVAFALAVTHPAAGNIGGGGFMLIRLADGRSTFIDFRERAPLSASRDMYIDPVTGNPTSQSVIGYRAVGVPGTVFGMDYAHARYGKRPWKELVEPAVRLARDGFPLSWGLSQNLRSQTATDKLSQFPESKRIFLKDGVFYDFGEVFKQPELAATLTRIRDTGAKDFYEGETARLLAADMAAHGGNLTLEDLKDYKAIERAPLEGRYKGYGILTAPPPSSGGVGLLQMLGVLERTDYAKSGAGSAYALHCEAEAMRRYFADRAEYLGDPDFVKLPLAALLNPAYIAKLRESIDPAKATPSEQIHAGDLAPYESPQTTHYSIVDEMGNAVSVTYTLNTGFGSGVTATGLGFLLNDEMDDFASKPGEPNTFGLVQGEANAIAPRKTPLSSMTPTIVTKDGRLYMVVGTPGGPTIINTVLQVILNVIDFGMNMQRAVDQPRIHHQWLPDTLTLEDTVSPDTVELLKQRGHNIRLVNAIGDVAAIRLDGQWIEGAPDGRTEATAKGY